MAYGIVDVQIHIFLEIGLHAPAALSPGKEPSILIG
jgi:hypothetical protein